MDRVQPHRQEAFYARERPRARTHLWQSNKKWYGNTRGRRLPRGPRPAAVSFPRTSRRRALVATMATPAPFPPRDTHPAIRYAVM
jgi:hypothetical protein